MTYRCNLSCVHCYCAGDKAPAEELTTKEWFRIFDLLHSQGVLFLVFSGGEPLLRPDLPQLYEYAIRKGFLVSIFTNAIRIPQGLLDLFAQYPPLCVEVTMNGASAEVFESVTCVSGSFQEALAGIRSLLALKVPVVLKTVCLKENKQELAAIKRMAEELLGKPEEKKYRFKFDMLVLPRLDGGKEPLAHRLAPEEISWVTAQDPDIAREYCERVVYYPMDFSGDPAKLYRCASWQAKCYVDPSGRLKHCLFSRSRAVDLRKEPIRRYHSLLAKELKRSFRTDSRCKECKVRQVCYWCPARAALETGAEESPVEYYCAITRHEQSQRHAHTPVP